MSLRNYVPSYPPLSVNGPPPPHHQGHRVQPLPANVATALQQQISQQQAAAAQQQQSQGGGQSNQNGGQSEYHIAPCLPFQTPAGANLAQNFIRHMSSSKIFLSQHFLCFLLRSFGFLIICLSVHVE